MSNSRLLRKFLIFHMQRKGICYFVWPWGWEKEKSRNSPGSEFSFCIWGCTAQMQQNHHTLEFDHFWGREGGRGFRCLLLFRPWDMRKACAACPEIHWFARVSWIFAVKESDAKLARPIRMRSRLKNTKIFIQASVNARPIPTHCHRAVWFLFISVSYIVC